MSATAIAEDEVVEEAKPRKRKVLALVLLAVLLGVAGGGWWYLGPAAADEPPVDADGEIVAVPAMTTTVGEGSPHHARVSLGIVLQVDIDPTVVEPQLPLLQDALLREMAAMSAEELRSAAGSDALRERLGAEARSIWGEDVVRRVIVTELLVQ